MMALLRSMVAMFAASMASQERSDVELYLSAASMADVRGDAFDASTQRMNAMRAAETARKWEARARRWAR